MLIAAVFPSARTLTSCGPGSVGAVATSFPFDVSRIENALSDLLTTIRRPGSPGVGVGVGVGEPAGVCVRLRRDGVAVGRGVGADDSSGFVPGEPEAFCTVRSVA